MSEPNINTVNLIAGRRGAGKTTFMKELIKVNSLPKALICDTFDHPAYNEYENIAIPQLPTFRKGVRHLFGSDTNLIFDAVTNIHNCLVVYEDATKYIEDSVPDKVKKYILDTKQKNVNLCLLFHSLADIPPKLFRWADTLTVFKTGDIIENQKTRIRVYDKLLPVWNRVMLHPNKYYNETILVN